MYEVTSDLLLYGYNKDGGVDELITLIH